MVPFIQELIYFSQHYGIAGNPFNEDEAEEIGKLLALNENISQFDLIKKQQKIAL